MSKLVDIGVNCPYCGNHYEAKVFRTYWGESESARAKVFNDEINIVTCPHCGKSFHAPLAMMYVDCQTGFAVWWEPFHDKGIDSDIAGYSSMFGESSYYAQAPRIADWDDFKSTIQKYYSGELKANPIQKFDINSLSKSSRKNQTENKSGCLGTMIAICTFAVSLISLSVYGIKLLL
ncbi:MAG: hypothetical protein KBS72_03720 [Bacteroidales bacterium]|nr:hypothetical protein [Candidatus Cacconaster scatequi]